MTPVRSVGFVWKSLIPQHACLHFDVAEKREGGSRQVESGFFFWVLTAWHSDLAFFFCSLEISGEDNIYLAIGR